MDSKEEGKVDSPKEEVVHLEVASVAGVAIEEEEEVAHHVEDHVAGHAVAHKVVLPVEASEVAHVVEDADQKLIKLLVFTLI